MSRLPVSDKEACYLTDEAKAFILTLESQGVDSDLALEVAVIVLGEKVVYEL